MLILAISLFLFALTIIFQKFVLLSGVPINAFLALRMLVPAVFLSFFEILRGRKHDLMPLFKPKYVAIACLTTFLPLFLKNLAHSRMSSGKFALIGSIDPFVTCVLTFILFGQLISRQKITGIMFAVVGVGILSFNKIPLELSERIFFFLSWPELFAILAVTLGRLGWIACQTFLKNGLLSETQANIVFMGFPGILAASLTVLNGQMSQLFSDFNLKTWIAIISSIFINALACILMTKSLKKFSAVTISLSGTCIIPICVALGGALIYNEPITLAFFGALSLIFTGLMIFNTDRKLV